MKKILCTVDVSDEICVLDEFENIQLDIRVGITKEKLLEIVANYDGILAADLIEYDEKVFSAADNLVVLTRFGTGIENVNLDDATNYEVMITNIPGANAESVAEHTIGLMIAASKNFFQANNEMIRGNWVRKIGKGLELAGKTLGQVGIGRIGSLVARKARSAFGMNLLVHDPYVTNYKVESEFGKKCDFDELIENADVISINVPLTEETKNMFGMEEFRRMKNSAIIVNTSRGEIIKEEELARALKDGEIYATGLDVLREEPSREDNPLFGLDHVVITPHSAGTTFEAFESQLRKALHEQVRAFHGEEPEFLLNKKVL